MKRIDPKTKKTLTLMKMADRGVQKARPRSAVFKRKGIDFDRNYVKNSLRKEYGRNFD